MLENSQPASQPASQPTRQGAMFRQVTIGIMWITFCLPQGDAVLVDTVCNSTECAKLAQQIEEQMGNSSACTDFHDYVCGKWNGSKELQEADLKKKALTDLVGLLDCAVAAVTEELNATEKLINAYHSCTKKANDTEALQNSSRNILGLYNIGEWPITQETAGKEQSNISYQEILQRTGPRPLFRYYISTQKSSQPIIVMTVPSEFYVSGVDYADLYPESLSESPVEEREEENAGTGYTYYEDKSEEAYREFIKKAISLLAPARQEQKEETAEEIIGFEKNLSKIYSYAKNTTENMTLDALSSLAGNLPMDKVLGRDFKSVGMTISGSTNVIVEYLDYYKKVVEFLTNATSTVALRNYILWTEVRSMSEAEGTELHSLYLEYKNKTAITFKEKLPSKEDTKQLCLRQLLRPDIMYTAGANFYATAKFNETYKMDVLKMMKFINSTFSHVISNNTWMSNTTKQRAIERLAKMDLVIGYPDWIMNNSLVNTLYQFVPNISLGASFVEHYHWLKENEHIQGLLKLNSSYFEKEYENVTLRSHAYYAERTDTVVYPAAALVTHYRNIDIPRALNFGTIGTILAQLLTQSIDRFDDQIQRGRKTKYDFWDNDTTDQFCTRSSCLNNTEECIDRGCVSTKLERLYDYFGVRVSHIALNRSKENYSNPFLLPGAKFDSEDKIFFTGFGSLYCPYSVNEKKVQARADLPDDFFQNSLNEIVSQYQDFNSTFNCSGGVTDTCDLMPPPPKSGSEVC